MAVSVNLIVDTSDFDRRAFDQDRFDKALTEVISEIMPFVASNIVRLVRNKLPKRTGRLRQSVTARIVDQPGQQYIQLYALFYYGPVQAHFGRNYVGEVLDSVRADVTALINGRLAAKLRG